MMTAELTSGVGYWTPDGELILEADEKCTRSLSHETDGDIDSNCEEYGANDYPDEEEEEEEEDEENDRHKLRWHGWQGHRHHGYEDDSAGDDGMFLHVQDNYDEYDWEDDLEHENMRHHYHHRYDYSD